MIMKKLLYIIILGILSSCSSSFLDLYPETSLNEGNFYKSETEFILLANGCYVPMRELNKVDNWVMAEMASDNTSFMYNTTTGEASKMVLDEFILASDNVVYKTFWSTSYSGINRCNKLLSEIDRPEVVWVKSANKDRCMGEALFLRAYYYFNLVQQYGGVPIVLTPITSEEAKGIKRSTVDDVYKSIIDDLKSAITHFKVAIALEENGRANLGSSLSLLGKVYLTYHKYPEAEASLKEVMDLGKYSLLPVYANLFNPANKDFKETIFSVQYSENSVELSNRFIFYFAPWSSGGAVTTKPGINISGTAGWNQPTDDLINAFETGDLRKNVSIAYWTGKDWDGLIRPIPYCGKYKAPQTAPDDRCGDNFPILRYSDVLLMYAEALNEQDKTSAAIPYVQQVRTRAGLTAALTGYTKTTLQDLIAKERQTEFCFENQRYYDLKRTGKALSVLAAHGVREKTKKPFLYSTAFDMKEYKLLAPIPAEQILVNQLDQNPGY
jgi:tetratricopeptide (TPR) repeat protein